MFNMGIVKELKQYGNLVIAVLITVGFGATFMLYGNGSQQPDTGQEEEMNFTAPSQNFVVGSFNKSYTEQIVIAAQEDAVFVNAFYENESDREQLEQLETITQNFGDRVYIQVADSSQGGEIISRNSVVEFPSVVVQGGLMTRRGPAPQQQTVTNITQVNVERAICNTLTELGGQAARCQQIGAF